MIKSLLKAGEIEKYWNENWETPIQNFSQELLDSLKNNNKEIKKENRKKTVQFYSLATLFVGSFGILFHFSPEIIHSYHHSYNPIFAERFLNESSVFISISRVAVAGLLAGLISWPLGFYFGRKNKYMRDPVKQKAVNMFYEGKQIPFNTRFQYYDQVRNNIQLISGNNDVINELRNVCQNSKLDEKDKRLFRETLIKIYKKEWGSNEVCIFSIFMNNSALKNCSKDKFKNDVCQKFLNNNKESKWSLKEK